MFSALILSVLAQAPAPAGPSAPPRDLAVFVSRRMGVADARADLIARKVVDFLKAAEFPVSRGPVESAVELKALGVKDSADCNGKRVCVAGLGRVLRVWGVVAVDVGDVEGTLAIHIEVVQSTAGQKVAAFDLLLPSKGIEAELPRALGPFRPILHSAFETSAPEAAPAEAAAPVEPKPLPADAPTATVLTPEPAPVVIQAEPSSGPPAITIVAGGAAVVALAVAIVFLVQGGQTKDQLDAARVIRGGAVAYNIPEADARSMVVQANTDYSVALGSGVGALIFAGVGSLLWAIK